MGKVIVNATDVRNNLFNLINKVVATGEPIFIKRNREVLVKIEPVGDELSRDASETEKLLDATRGLWAGRSEVETGSRFRKANLASSRKIRERNW